MYKKLIFSILFFISVLGLSSQEINKTDAQGRKQGLWKKFYPDNTLKYEGAFKNDLPFGTFRYYHENGVLKAELKYHADGTGSHAVLYNEAGKKIAEGMYIGQEKDGKWLLYDDETGLLRAKEFYKRDVPDGEWTIFHNDGTSPSEVEHWVNGQKEGVQISYFDDGTKRQEMFYKNGQPDGKFTSYHQNGAVRGSGEYKNHQKDGVWIYYDDTGKITVKDYYKNDELMKSEEW